MIRLLRTGVAAVVLATILLGAMLGWNLWTYHRLSNEAWVADLGFTRIADRTYLAVLHPQEGPSRQYQLHGDDWQLDARLVTWDPWMQLLGNDPIFRMDRLAGRYRSVDEARATPPTVWSLADDNGLDLWSLARDNGAWLPGVDAAYGTAVFLPMADGARYRVTVSARGLVARPYNEQAASAISTWN